MILDDSSAFPATFLGAMRIGAVRFGSTRWTGSTTTVLPRRQLCPRSWSRRRCHRARGVVAERPSLQVLVVGGEQEPPPASTSCGRKPCGGCRRRWTPTAMTWPSGSTAGLDRPAEGRRPPPRRHRGDRRDVCPQRAPRSSSEDLCFSTTKLFHAYGLGNALSFPLSVGASSVLVRGRAAPERIFETVRARRPTLFFSVPALYAAMVKSTGGLRG